MAKGQEDPKFKRHQKVVAVVDLPGVPAGTKGKVQLVNGFRWIRYWVVFKNGVELGQLGNEQLTTPDAWDAAAQAHAKRERAAVAERRRAEYLANTGQPQAG